jgi:hypothetical protein
MIIFNPFASRERELEELGLRECSIGSRGEATWLGNALGLLGGVTRPGPGVVPYCCQDGAVEA